MGRYCERGRDKGEDTPRLTIDDLRAWGFIPKGSGMTSGIITLSRNGAKTGSLGATVHIDGAWSYIKFDYLLGYDKKPVAYEHEMELFPCYFGSHRYFFPCRHCMRILANPATDSGLNRPPFGAKRRWGFIICPCGRNESRIFAFSWILP